MNAIEVVFPYRGFHGGECKCGLRVIPLHDGRTAVICSELPDNPGTSVTNFAEDLAALVCAEFGIDPKRLVWIEHYVPHRGHPEPDWDLVTFKIALHDGRQAVLAEPQWRSMRDADWCGLGLPLPQSD
jgi:hypothetical protein